MSTLIRTMLAVAVAGMTFSAAAQQAADHTQHHPSTPAAAAPTAQPAVPQAAAPKTGMPMGMSPMPQMQQMQQHMATMQTLRANMANAKTPAEREALMADHMKAMQEGMDMMHNMMEMMMQRMPPHPAGAGPQ